MSAATYDLAIEQGSRFLLTITWRDANGDPINLTGYSVGGMKLRELELVPHVHAGDVVQDWSAFVTITTPASGLITVDVPATSTDDLTAVRGLYDLELIPASGAAHAFKLLKGRWSLEFESTK